MQIPGTEQPSVRQLQEFFVENEASRPFRMGHDSERSASPHCFSVNQQNKGAVHSVNIFDHYHYRESTRGRWDRSTEKRLYRWATVEYQRFYESVFRHYESLTHNFLTLLTQLAFSLLADSDYADDAKRCVKHPHSETNNSPDVNQGISCTPCYCHNCDKGSSSHCGR